MPDLDELPGSGIEIVLADDHTMVRRGLRMVLDAEDGLSVVAEAGDIDGALRETRELADAVAQLGRHADLASKAADVAVKCDRHLEYVYRVAMAALLETDDLREVTARRELYRRCSRIGETVVDVAERIQYAVVKES